MTTEIPISAEPTRHDVLLFDLRGRRCALPVATVREVLPPPPATPVPLAPRVLRGVIALRGHALPLLDLGVHLSPQSAPDAREGSGRPSRGPEHVLVVEETLPGEPAPVRAALVVERIVRIVSIDDQQTRPASGGAPRFVAATVLDAEGAVLLLDAAIAIADVMVDLRNERSARRANREGTT